MEINELRIGNTIYVKKLHSDFGIQTGINILTEDLMLKMIQYRSVRHQIFPLKITSGTLKRLGFSFLKAYQVIENPDEIDESKIRWTEILVYQLNYDVSYHLHPDYNFLAIKCLRLDCKYVHELQNQVYYFNQTELSFKEI